MELSLEAVKTNKSKEEKIREYVWLHADEPVGKIQAGMMEEFGENRSLEWIAREREEYLAADGSSTVEHSFSETSIDDEAIRAIAEAFPSVTQKQIREIIRLKTTTRLGYRRIGKKLNPPLGKDAVMRIWKMCQAAGKQLKSPELTREEEELEKLRTQVAQKEQLKRLQEEKEELLRQDVLLSLETEVDNLVLRIVEDEVAEKHPETYQEFRQYCEHQNLTPQAALQKMGLTASNLIDDFDDWYEFWREDGYSGMECLTWEIWSEINAFLYEFIKQRISKGNKGTEHEKNPSPLLSKEECERMDRAFATLLQIKGNNLSIDSTRRPKNLQPTLKTKKHNLTKTHRHSQTKQTV